MFMFPLGLGRSTDLQLKNLYIQARQSYVKRQQHNFNPCHSFLPLVIDTFPFAWTLEPRLLKYIIWTYPFIVMAHIMNLGENVYFAP